MKYTLDKNEKYTVFQLGVENLNSLNAPDLKAEFIVLKNEGVRNFVLDLKDVKYIDSSGLSAVLRAQQLFAGDGTGSFVLTGVNSPSVISLMKVSRLDSIFTIIPTLQESIEYVMMEELQREINKD